MKLYPTDDDNLSVLGKGERWTIKDIHFEFNCGMNRARLLLKKAQRTGVLSKTKNSHGGWDVIGKYKYNFVSLRGGRLR